jgi:hypothetical protein
MACYQARNNNNNSVFNIVLYVSGGRCGKKQLKETAVPHIFQWSNISAESSSVNRSAHIQRKEKQQQLLEYQRATACMNVGNEEEVSCITNESCEG